MTKLSQIPSGALNTPCPTVIVEEVWLTNEIPSFTDGALLYDSVQGGVDLYKKLLSVVR
ncbi:hypothetical protein [Xylella fastidiosa]|nr:hypothetical protein [Xylella fastidiosa]